ncbi:hypothetical protein SBRCBS47491_001650 [Sporothrix bragantina]|uniref:Zn(2)-C6 fungal-type domain-containing protein n=1 Tax=Sporothrix bragantina TaxID=671064 RepID=A0ABP0B097_9PEZI
MTSTTPTDLTDSTATAMAPATTAASGTGLSPSGRLGSSSASTSGASPAYRVTQARRAPPKRLVERSCIVCHRRKVKCDKTMPCANCVRSGVLCCYPSNKRAPRQPKTTIADIASRLVQLERTIVAVAGGDAGGDTGGDDDSDGGDHTHTNGNAGAGNPNGHSDRRASGSGGDDDTASIRNSARNNENDTAAHAILLRNAYASRYINEVLLSRVLEEEEEIRSALTSPKVVDADDAYDDHASETTAPAVTLFGALTNGPYIPRSPSMRNINSKLHPSTRHAMVLWNTYLQNVEPMNKVLHVPTAQISVFTAIQSPESREPGFESLLFSIYYSTVTTYLPDEYCTLFGEDKGVALDRYRTGMERALVQARFFESPSLLILQALTLFLRTSRAHSAGQAVWIVYGMVLRLAQSIGLHRDGANFGLSPFECEMRRRIWGHMLKQDDRSAEDHGIDVGVPDTYTDIQEALNINDSDMYPEIKELPKAQMYWTEMTAPVCIRRLGITVAYVIRLITEMKAAQCSGIDRSAEWAILYPDLPLTEERRMKIMTERNQYVDDLLKQCSMVVPVQRATYKMARLIQLKFNFITRLQLATILARNDSHSDSSGNAKTPDGNNVPVIATEENLHLACEVIELNFDIMDDELIQDFRWTSEIYPQYHVLLYVLWHLCVKPVSNSNPTLRDRAWAVANGMYAMEDSRQKRQNVRGRNSKWTMLMTLRDKAVKVRAAMDQAEMAGQRAAKGPAAAAQSQGAPINGLVSGVQDVHMDDSSVGLSDLNSRPVASAHPLANVANASHPGASAFDQSGPASGYGAVSAPTTGTLASGTTAVDPSVGSMAFGHAEFADADMTEFLGDSTLGMGMDMDWVRGFMDWDAVADDFRMRTYEAGH